MMSVEHTQLVSYTVGLTCCNKHHSGTIILNEQFHNLLEQ